MDIQLFDNFEDDGQLSMFDMTETVEESVEEPVNEPLVPAAGSGECRIKRCSTCGKTLFVKEEAGCYFAVCNACGISYSQKKPLAI